MDEIEDWYCKRSTATKEKQDRVLAAAAFLHHASIADDIEQFLHLFIVVDALFGERFKVREKIIEGTKKVFPGDVAWEQRVNLLMDLRSEVVHGVVSEPTARGFPSAPLACILVFHRCWRTLTNSHRS